MPTGHGLPIAALVSWLLTEALGAFMLRSWVASGSAGRAQRRPANPDGMSLPILAGHAGLNLAGLVSWITFVVSGVPAFAFVAIAFMAPAIGLGISTVTIWTPYPTRRARTEDQPAYCRTRWSGGHSMTTRSVSDSSTNCSNTTSASLRPEWADGACVR